MKKKHFFILSIGIFVYFNCNAQLTTLNTSEFLGKPRKPKSTSFYSSKLFKGDSNDKNLFPSKKKKIVEVEKIILPEGGKTIIYDSSTIPFDNEIKNTSNDGIDLFDNTLIVQRAGFTHQISIDFKGDGNLKSFWEDNQVDIKRNIFESFDQEGTTPSKILIESNNSVYNLFILRSPEFTETIRTELINQKLLLSLKSCRFYGDILEFQKAYGINETGILDANTIKSINEYKEFYEYKVIPAIKKDILLRFKENKYLINQNDNIEVLENDGVYKIRGLLEDDIITIEEEKQYNLELLPVLDNEVVISINSRDDKSQKAGLLFGSELVETDWVDVTKYDEVFTSIDNYFNKNPKKTTILLLRDTFNKNPFALEKSNSSSLFGDKVLSNRYVENRTWVNTTEFLREFRNKYPDKKIILSSRTDRFGISSDLMKFKKSPIIKSSNDIAAYIAPKSFDVSGDQVASMRKTLTEGNIKVFDVDEELATLPLEAQKANVLLLSGHKDKLFEKYLKNLAENGILKNKVICMFSCNESGTANLHSYLINTGKARQIIFFPSKISVPATKATLKEIIKITKPMVDLNGNGMTLDELINEALNNALKNPDYEDLKDDFLLLKLFASQMSFINTNQIINGEG